MTTPADDSLPPTRAERYLAHLDRLTGDAEPTITGFPSSDPALPGVTVMTYRDLPEPGMLTALTYGLSLGRHPDWRHRRPELCLTLRTDDDRWALAMGALAAQLRGSCPFAYGDTIDYGGPVTEGSPLSAFVVFAPAALAREDFLGLEVGEGDVVDIAGLYPVHASERAQIREHGLEQFWTATEWDPYDVQRPPTV